MKFPVLITKNVILKELKGEIKIISPLTFGMVKIGFDGVGTFDVLRSKAIWQVNGTVIFDEKAHIGHGSKLTIGVNGILECGKNFAITAESSIIVDKRVKFGDNCLLSWDILIIDTDFHQILSNNKVINQPAEIVIEDSVWIGCRTTILKGSYIASGCIIGASSVVTKKLNTCNSIYVGNPARLSKENISWEI